MGPPGRVTRRTGIRVTPAPPRGWCRRRNGL